MFGRQMQEPMIELCCATGDERGFVISSPHSGRHYPDAFIKQSKLSALDLRRSEDAFVDELFADAPSLGAPLLKAHFPRAYVDVNRDVRELDPSMFDAPLPQDLVRTSPRVASGLGMIPRIVSEHHIIYDKKLPISEAIERINRCYQPFHHELTNLLVDRKEKLGHAILIDCHSMPSRSWANRNWPDIILGDRYGAACHSDIVAAAGRILSGLGYKVALNKPYAGGYITERYGRPQEGYHALQIEVNRALYLNEATVEKKREFETIKADMTSFLTALMAIEDDIFLPCHKEAAE